MNYFFKEGIGFGFHGHKSECRRISSFLQDIPLVS